VLSRVIEVCAHNRFLVFTTVLLLTLAGIWSLQHVPLDALPDISDVQVIVHTAWAGEPPDVIEDQMTYPSSPACWLRLTSKSCSRKDNVRGLLCLRGFSGRHGSLLGSLACH
jgi:Cu/Ag efflux pump CusA